MANAVFGGWVWEGPKGNAYILFGNDGIGKVSKLTWIDMGRTPEEKAAWEGEQIAWERERRWRTPLDLRLRNFFDSFVFNRK